MSPVFKKIESGDVFTRDFSPLVRDNEIAFPTSEEIAQACFPGMCSSGQAYAANEYRLPREVSAQEDDAPNLPPVHFCQGIAVCAPGGGITAHSSSFPRQDPNGELFRPVFLSYGLSQFRDYFR